MPENQESIYDVRWSAFTQRVHERLQKGAQEYGDKSFHLSPLELSGEIEEELFDILGWAFILWCRLQGLKAAVTRSMDADIEEKGIVG